MSLQLQIMGDLTFDSVKEQKESLLKNIQLNGDVVINLKQVGQADSAGLAFLIELKRRAINEKSVLRFSDVPQQLTALAEFCGVTDVLLDV